MQKPLQLAARLALFCVAAMNAGCTSEPPPDPVSATAASAAKASQTKPRPKLLPGARTRVLEAAGDRDYDKTFDDLRFDIEVGAKFERKMLPETIAGLDGEPIRIRGFILPTPQKRGIKQFVLVRDNQECCFGPGAALFDCILVDMNQGQSAEYTIRPVAVKGKFEIEEVVIDGKHWAIYHIAGDEVK
jgi:hypothetical protein